MMSKSRLIGMLSVLVVLGAQTAALSPAYAPDPVLLENKGFSPQTVDAIELQVIRQEWKEPPPPTMTPAERFIHNMILNNWVGNFDAFGSHIIRERQ